MYFSANMGPLEPRLETWVRQRGKALYTADGQLAYDVEDLADFFAFWLQMQEDGLTPPADLMAQATATGKMEETMLVTGHALFDFVHSNQLVGTQKLVPDEVGITMIPNQKGGKPGQYLKPSMLLSMSATAPDPDAAAKLMSFFLTDNSAADVLLIERGVSGDASIREQITPKLSDTEKKIIAYLDIVATHVGPLPPPPPKNAGELERALAPAWEIDSLQEDRRAAGREGLLRNGQGSARARLTETREPWPQRPSATSHSTGGALQRRLASGSAFSAPGAATAPDISSSRLG